MNLHKVAVRLAAEQTFRITLLLHPQAEVFTFDSYLWTLLLLHMLNYLLHYQSQKEKKKFGFAANWKLKQPVTRGCKQTLLRL